MTRLRRLLIRTAQACCWAADRLCRYDHTCPDHATDVTVGVGCQGWRGTP